VSSWSPVAKFRMDFSTADEAVLATLPEDAPPNSDAWKRCGKCKGPFSNCVFTFVRDGVKKPFQTTLGKAGGFKYAAERILRACWVKIHQDGQSKDEVLRWRDELYDRVAAAQPGGPARGAAAAPPDGAAAPAAAVGSSADAAAQPGQERVLEEKAAKAKKNKKEKAKESNGKAKESSPTKETKPATSARASNGASAPSAAASASGASPEVEDAPIGHDAWIKVKYEPLAAGHFKFRYLDSKSLFRVAVGRCDGDVELAGRVARLCYVKMEAGAPYEECQQLREDLYTVGFGGKRSKAPGGEESAPPAKKAKAGGGTAKAGKVAAGALRVDGRSKDKKNASINGIYVPLQSLFDGAIAYQKQQAGDKDRFLYYQASKSRWKINNKLGGSGSGFGYASVTDGGKASVADAGESVKWLVVDNKGGSYIEDADVRCVRLSPDPDEFAKQLQAEKAKDPAKVGRSASVQEVSDDNTQKEKNGASDHSSGRSDGDSRSDDDGTSADNSDASSDDSASSDEASAVPGRPPPAAAFGRVCAKMLVRSHLRCACHYMYSNDCPTAKGKA